MFIGYARVSTVGQELETQEEILNEVGCKKIFVEKVTGTSTAPRTELKNAMEFVRKDDTLVITKIDRLARSIIDLNKLVTELVEKGVTVKFVSEGMEFKPGEAANSLHSLLFNVLGSFAQFERDMIVERTTEGRERAIKQGKHMGRPAQPKAKIKRALELYDNRETNKMSVKEIIKMTGISRSTIYHELKKRKAKQQTE